MGKSATQQRAAAQRAYDDLTVFVDRAVLLTSLKSETCGFRTYVVGRVASIGQLAAAS